MAYAEVPEVPGVRQPADKNAAVRVAQILQLSGFIHSHTPGVRPVLPCMAVAGQ